MNDLYKISLTWKDELMFEVEEDYVKAKKEWIRDDWIVGGGGLLFGLLISLIVFLFGHKDTGILIQFPSVFGCMYVLDKIKIYLRRQQMSFEVELFKK